MPPGPCSASRPRGGDGAARTGCRRAGPNPPWRARASAPREPDRRALPTCRAKAPRTTSSAPTRTRLRTRLVRHGSLRVRRTPCAGRPGGAAVPSSRRTSAVDLPAGDDRARIIDAPPAACPPRTRRTQCPISRPFREEGVGIEEGPDLHVAVHCGAVPGSGRRCLVPSRHRAGPPRRGTPPRRPGSGPIRACQSAFARTSPGSRWCGGKRTCVATTRRSDPALRRLSRSSGPRPTSLTTVPSHPSSRGRPGRGGGTSRGKGARRAACGPWRRRRGWTRRPRARPPDAKRDRALSWGPTVCGACAGRRRAAGRAGPRGASSSWGARPPRGVAGRARARQAGERLAVDGGARRPQATPNTSASPRPWAMAVTASGHAEKDRDTGATT